MQHSHKTTFTPTLRTFISKVITPVVLVTGVLLLIIFNFDSTLREQQASENDFRSLVTYNQGVFQLDYDQASGLNRPEIYYGSQQLLSFAEWNSTMSVDGQVVNLWDNNQGYDIDDAHRTIYSTVSGPDGTQLNQVTTLVNDHTVTVSFNFSLRPQSATPPTHYTVSIAHVNTANYWYDPLIKSGTFSAYVMRQVGGLSSSDASNIAASLGKITVTTGGGDLAGPNVTYGSVSNTTTSAGGLPWTQSFGTQYTINNPTPARLIYLGTETITFQPTAAKVGAALP